MSSKLKNPIAETLTGMEIVGELLGFAENCLRVQMRQRNQNVTSEEINEEIRLWYLRRDGAEFGDCSEPVNILKNFTEKSS